MRVYPHFRGRHQLPRSGHRSGEVRRLLAVRRRLPGRLHPRRRGHDTPEHRVSAGERYAAVYEIDLSRCVFCGYCEVTSRSTRSPSATAPRVGLRPLGPRLRGGDAARRAPRRTPLGGKAVASRRVRAMFQSFFFLTAILAIGGAIGVVTLRDPSSTCWRWCRLIALAGLFLLLRAEFVTSPGDRLRRCRHRALRVVVTYVGGQDGRSTSGRARSKGHRGAVRRPALRRALHRDPRDGLKAVSSHGTPYAARSAAPTRSASCCSRASCSPSRPPRCCCSSPRSARSCWRAAGAASTRASGAVFHRLIRPIGAGTVHEAVRARRPRPRGPAATRARRASRTGRIGAARTRGPAVKPCGSAPTTASTFGEVASVDPPGPHPPHFDLR